MRGPRWSLLLLLLLLPGGLAAAQAGPATADLRPQPTPSPSPWRGTLIGLQNSVTLTTLDRDAELTYNPTDSFGLTLAPQLWVRDWLKFSAFFVAVLEVTDADDTTQRREVVPFDLRFTVASPRVWTVPYLGLELTPDLRVVLPTSKLSRLRTLQVGLGPALTIARVFPALRGVSFTYTYRVTRLFHRYTSGERQEPPIAACTLSPEGCDYYLNTGVMNPRFSQSHTLALDAPLAAWARLSVEAAFMQAHLYPVTEDQRVSLTPDDPSNVRYTSSYTLEYVLVPTPYLEVALGVSTSVMPQQAPDSTRYRPFLNRFTSPYLEVRGMWPE